MTLSRRDQEIVHGAGAAEEIAGGIRGEGEHEQDHQDHDGVHVIGQEGGLDTAEHGVEHDTDGQQETGGGGRHAGQGGHDGGAAGQQHGRHEDVGHQAEDDVDAVCRAAVARADRLEEGVGVGRLALQLDRQRGEEDDLHGGTAGVPERAGDTIAVGDAGGLQERRGPGPGGDDGGGDQTGLDGAAGGAEDFGRLQFVVVSAQDEGGQHHTEAVILLVLAFRARPTILSRLDIGDLQGSTYAKRKPRPMMTP